MFYLCLYAVENLKKYLFLIYLLAINNKNIYMT